MKICLKIMVFCVAIFICYASAEAFALTPESAAKLAINDASKILRIPHSTMIFSGEIELFAGVLRVPLLYLNTGQTGLGRLFAIYEIEVATNRILRRDYSTAFQDQIPGLEEFFKPLNVQRDFSAKKLLFQEIQADDPQTNAPSLAFRGPTPHRGDKTAGFRIGIQGVLRNIPGYILNSPDFLSRFKIWAEANGRVVATETEIVGNAVYLLKGVPITVKSVAIKAKIRGYDLLTLHPGVIINPDQPAGTIAGIDIDFHTLQPIFRDVRIIVQSTNNPESPSFPNGAKARVYARETGQTVEVISVNGMAEALLPQIPTGWPLRFAGVNLDQGFYYGELGPITIPEDGGSAYTDILLLH